ncbi:Purine permease 3 [Glycine max]|nr:Purine permease 3 [Glycine max]
MKHILLITNYLLLTISTFSGPLVMRLYFLHGGHHVWLSSFLKIVNIPHMILPLTISYLRRHRTASIVEAIKLKLISIKPSLLIDLNDYLYA